MFSTARKCGSQMADMLIGTLFWPARQKTQRRLQAKPLQGLLWTETRLESQWAERSGANILDCLCYIFVNLNILHFPLRNQQRDTCKCRTTPFVFLLFVAKLAIQNMHYVIRVGNLYTKLTIS